MSERVLKPLIIPVFIPNQGCPHKCLFCEQEKITSQPIHPITKEHIEKVLKTAINSRTFDPGRRPEVAFFGGTFTKLPIEQMKRILEIVAPYLKKGLFHSVRVSTRPDCLDMERLNIMKDFGVRTVELGTQSMDNKVLSLSKRGHSAEDTVGAVRILKKEGFKVGIQLMPGLPGDSANVFYSTTTKILNLHPDMVRLYPAIVIRGTGLALWYKEGRYEPLTLDEAVGICTDSCIRFEREGIPVIRIGLMSSPSLLEEGQILAGPWHPAFGHLVRSAIHFKNIEPDLPGPGESQQIIIRTPRREMSLVRGYKNQGLRLIEKKTGAEVVGIEPDDFIPSGRVEVNKI